MDTPHTNRLCSPVNSPTATPDRAIMRLGFLAVVEQLQLQNELLESLLGLVEDQREDLKVGEESLGEVIAVQVASKQIDHDNLANAIAFAIRRS